MNLLVLLSTSQDAERCRPPDHATDGDHHEEHEPEPEQSVELLVQSVDGEDAGGAHGDHNATLAHLGPGAAGLQREHLGGRVERGIRACKNMYS